MSTHDPIHDPFNDPTEGSSSSSDVVARIEHEVCHSQPIVRDLNRHLTDLLGACPITADARWVNLLVTDDNPEGAVVFPHLPVHEALRLTTALRQIALEVDFGGLRDSLPKSRSYSLFDLTMPATFVVGPHDTVGTGSKFHRKGR